MAKEKEEGGRFFPAVTANRARPRGHRICSGLPHRGRWLIGYACEFFFMDARLLRSGELKELPRFATNAKWHRTLKHTKQAHNSTQGGHLGRICGARACYFTQMGAA